MNRTLKIGPLGKMVAGNTRCLRRDFNPTIIDQVANKKVMDWILKSKTYAELCFGIQMGLHNVGHTSVGGEVSFLQPMR